MSQIQLNIRTVFFSAGVIYLLNTLMIVTLWINHRRHISGIGFWVVSFLFFLAASMLIAFRNTVSLFSSFVLSNSLYVAAYVLMLDGFRAAENASKRYRWNYVWIPVFIPLFYWFTLVDLNYPLRIFPSYILYSALSLQIAYMHRRRLFGAKKNGAYAIIVFVYGSIGLLFILNSVLILRYSSRKGHALIPGVSEYLLAFILLYITMGSVISFVLQINMKLLERSMTAESSLREAHRDLLKQKSDKENLLVQYSKMAMIGEMMAAISHQWKQPVNAISLIAGDLEDMVQYETLTPDSIQEASKEINDQIDFMMATMDGFRNFFHPGSEENSFKACEMVVDLSRLFWKMFRTQNVELIIEKHEHFCVKGRPNDFKQVILNLITNAREAIVERGVEEGKIVFSFEVGDAEACIHVTDNGGGLPPGMAPESLFESYKASAKMKGEGIGLALVRMIVVERMKGRIYASNYGEGARFTICLPLAGEEGV